MRETNMRRANKWLGGLVVAVMAGMVVGVYAQAPAELIKQEEERVAVVKKVEPSVVAIFARGGRGGGSGVLISDDGFALTNFHVVQGSGPLMQCGLPDGVLYEGVLVGLDKVGDVALIKLLPKKEGQKFPFAALGDSDKTREGDWSLAMGNPFLLATDFTPTVTFGLISGVHRYQYPAGTLLEYTDCIQIDTSINPGNSGGPLFNMQGELIGINGRGSFDKRGRINSGVGYAISINQIKNFMGQLRAGLDTDHASLGALVTTQTEKNGLGRMIVTTVLEDSDVARRGLDLDDQIISFAGRPMSSVNHFKNVMGLYPRGWRMPLEFRHEQERKEVLVRLMGIQRRVLEDPTVKPPPGPGPKPVIVPKGPPSPAAKFYRPKAGFANYYFNKLEQDRLLAAFKKHGDFSGVAGDWTIDGTVRLKKARAESPIHLAITEEKDVGKGTKPMVRLKIEEFNPYVLDPLKQQDATLLKEPTGSGGLLGAMYVYHLLLTGGGKGFSEFSHGGQEPFYPPRTDGKAPTSLQELRVDTEVLNTRTGPYMTKWFFSLTDQKLLGFEVRVDDTEDPCEVYLSDYRAEGGRLLPHRMQVIFGNGHYGTFTLNRFQLAARK
jgi:S1-C subfamily serine protease